jgi:hypothetical protein
MGYTYKVTMSGVAIADPYALLKSVFPTMDGEPAEGCSSYAIVTFSTPQTPADLGPLVRVEQLPTNDNP